MTNIIGIVPLYKPKKDELTNIDKYVENLDYCYLLDDSGFSNENLCKTLIKEHPGKVEYVLNPQNIGLVASVNNGFSKALEKGADWVLIMNPDGTFQNDAISIYRDYIENSNCEKVGIIAPRFNTDRNPKAAKKGVVEIRYADMTGCLYNADVLRNIGFYDINTYFYSLDIEFCLRLRKNGYRIIECSEAVLNHKPGETFEVKLFGRVILKVGRDTPQRYYYQFRSFYYVNKKYPNISNVAFHVYKWLKVVLFFDNKQEYFKMINIGIQDAKRGFFGNINDRGDC